METQLGNILSVSKKKEKIRVLTGKITLLRRFSHAFFASRLS